jgi:acyl transferase domain-containing protein/NAD(P)H-dependent flavin oxidoreductase YrpB (nitropropane dioxygenase family)/NAD(P)-dependent dehydrogenase (short-subunit alcohol dehydrogenase family)
MWAASMPEFKKFVYTPCKSADAVLAVAASRAGGIGIYNAEMETDPALVCGQLDYLALNAHGEYGIKLDAAGSGLLSCLREFAQKGLRWLILDCEWAADSAEAIAQFRRDGVKVLAEVTTPYWPSSPLENLLDGLVVKGNEAGGFVGENSSYILLQRWLKQTGLPLYIHGGVTPNVAAACGALGVSGCVLDSQVLLLDESPLAHSLRPYLENLSGNETVAVGNGELGSYFRLLVRPGLASAQEFAARGEGQGYEVLQSLAQDKINWNEPRQGLLPVGQDVCFAGAWRKRYGHMAAVFRAIDAALDANLRLAVAAKPLAHNAPLAQALGIPLPIVQGPMTRTSDCAGFAKAISDGGALPMLAFALLKGDALNQLLSETKNILGERAWGIGLLGFAPQALLDEQIAAAKNYQPDYAIIAGGRPDQAVRLEEAGIPSFLHVPSANLLPLFLHEGARRFIFEGRECGGHIGPLSSFVLWSTMVDCLLMELGDGKIAGADIQILFAGGIHDAASSAMVQVLAAPLLGKGVKIGILMGSSYLFTREIVATGAVVQTFQEEVVGCERTVNLESGPGHASRCAYTPFAQTFFHMREEMRRNNVPVDESRKILDDLILGRLRIATKGVVRVGDKGELKQLGEHEQRHEGMYMLGQVATLRAAVTDIATLHREVSGDANALLAARLDEAARAKIVCGEPVDVAIVGIASLLPKANSAQDYWENILNKVDAITEIPSHRWDWRLYFDEDRNAKDKIYSKWGGFLDDLAFDPTRYGMPPKSIESVDPMQLMALEVARRTLADAGYEKREFNRERASVIIGASGGAGDVGMQYGLRSELARFQGELPDEVASRLPEWSEDTFAGILLNVIAGRIANRLNFGGVNFSTDAACASSLAAVYQGISELTAGRSDLVIAGGVDTVQGPFGYMCFSKTQALSPRGRCSTFDESADGIVISEGIAMVALKRLQDAERDGDRIYAVIKGIGGSSDGKAKGLSAPLPAGQLRAMRRAYQQAGFGPDTVGMFEAHGTGTVAGDTAELESTTGLVKEAGGKPHQAVVGSVKTMIGHTKATAGVAGLVKATLALHYRVLPPHPGVKRPNHVLQQSDCPLYLIDEATPWLADEDVPRRAAVSAFGFGGTNFHVVLEEYAREYRPWLRSAPSRHWPVELFLWHAADRENLSAQLSHIRGELGAIKNIELQNLAYSLARDWQPGGEVAAIVAGSQDELQAKIGIVLEYLQGAVAELPAGMYHGSAEQTGGKLAVLFSGQGSQYTGMMRELALHFPACAQTLSAADQHLSGAFDARFGAGARLSHFIFPRGCYGEQAQTDAAKALMGTDVAQPALGAVGASLWNMMRELGLAPDMLGGHSYGEFVALHAGGFIDFPTLMSLSEARGRLIVDAAKNTNTELGTMAAVLAARENIEQAIAAIGDVIVANHNAPMQSVISGSRAAVEQAVAILTQAGVDANLIPVAAAFHSAYVAPAQTLLAEVIAQSQWRDGEITVYSNTSGEPHSTEVNQTKERMADHLVRPVEFVAEIEAMYRDGARVFLELGPKSVLSKLAGRILKGRPYKAVALDDNGGGIVGLLAALGQLLCSGVELDVIRLYEGRHCSGGDAANLASLQRDTSTPKNAWLLNGSAVRRAGEPPRQVGVLAGQTSSHAADSARIPARTPLTVAQDQSITRHKEVAVMSEGRKTPTAEESAIMAEYFATMRQFLETQERVLASYIGGSAAAGSRPAVRAVPPVQARQRAPLPDSPAPISAPSAAAPVSPRPDYAAAKPAPAAGNADGMDREKMAGILLGIVENKTGYPQDMIGLDQNLEADLGIDSIKRIEIVGALLKALPDSYGQALGDKRGALNTQGTLNGMLDMLCSLQPGAKSTSVGEQINAATAVPTDKAVPPEPVAAEPPGEISREKMTDTLLGIVEGKTGYPRDMVGLDQNLEADLGIDSIKRIEIVGALLKALPDSYGQALGEKRGALNTQSTLNGMLDMLGGLPTQGGTSVPFDYAGTGTTAAVAARPSRHVVEPVQEPLDVLALRHLRVGHFLVAQDSMGLAAELAETLRGRGCQVSLVERGILEDEVLLNQWCDVQLDGSGEISGIVHLAQAGSAWLPADAALDEWRRQLQLNEKSLFTLLHKFSAKIADDAHILSASSLGGYFCRQGCDASGLSLQGGAVGLLKSLREERPTLRVKAVDLDRGQKLSSLIEALMEELELKGGRQEVGYPGGMRTVFHTVAAPSGADEQNAEAIRNLVVLATGGARGVTAEVLRELALPGNTLVLTGRTRLEDQEAAELKPLVTAEALRGHLIAEVRAKRLQLTPAEMQRKVQAILAAREMRGNIEDFRQRGAIVAYHAVDVTHEDELRQLLEQIRGQHGDIGGVVHGAGVIEDKLVADKTGESWSRVVETKVFGVLLLQKYLRPESLRFFTVFSSVAGRYGNSGQSDYATANELMNRLCCQLNELWNHEVNVSALCWGPWGATQFGAGMVTAETEAKFAQKGVVLVSADEGRRLFRDELLRSNPFPVEIICGAGPWEKHEAEIGQVEKKSPLVPGRNSPGPLLDDAVLTILPKGEQVFAFSIGDNHAYLQEHLIDGSPVLPAAVALEIMAEAASALWPGWKVVEVSDFQLLKGVEFKGKSPRLALVVNPSPYGSSDGFEVNAVIQSEQTGGKPRIHYRCVIRLALQMPAGFEQRPQAHSAKKLTVAKAYNEWLFHGLRFQVIREINGLSDTGSRALVNSTCPADWLLATAPEHARWIFDPALLDAAAQMALLWARAFRDQSALPARFGRVIRYAETLPKQLQMGFERIASADDSAVCANVYFSDMDGRVYLLIEGMECVSSSALNRLGGTAKFVSGVPA